MKVHAATNDLEDDSTASNSSNDESNLAFKKLSAIISTNVEVLEVGDGLSASTSILQLDSSE